MKNLKIYEKAQKKENYILKRNCSIIASFCITLGAACAISCNAGSNEDSSEILYSNDTSFYSKETEFSSSKIENVIQTSFDETNTSTISMSFTTKPISVSTINETPKPVSETKTVTSSSSILEHYEETSSTSIYQTTLQTPKPVVVSEPNEIYDEQDSTFEDSSTEEYSDVYSTLPDNYYLSNDMPNPLIDPYYTFYYAENNDKISINEDNINKPWYFPSYVEKIAVYDSECNGNIKYTVNYNSKSYSSLNLFPEKQLIYTLLYLDYLDDSTLKNMYGTCGVFTSTYEKITLEEITERLYMIKEYNDALKKDIENAKEKYEVEGFLPDFYGKLDDYINEIINNPDVVAQDFYERFNSKVYVR